jgi:DNA-binding Xre family transcriptional regulator
MPKKTKTVGEHLEIIEKLLAGIILKRSPNVKELAKIMGVSSDRLTELYPLSKNKGEDTEGS